MAEPSVWVIIPAYNEGQVLAETLRELQEYNASYHLVVVDDGSTDNTSGIAREFAVHLLVHPMNLGQGAALATGIEYALRQKADIVVTFDADGQMRPADINPLVEAVVKDGLDVALGSRFLKSADSKMPTLKKIILRLGTIFTRLTTGLNITDTHNGLRAFKAETFAKLHITQNGMAHASEILTAIARCKLTYRELPVTIRYTEYSKRKGQGASNAINILFELFSRGGK
ncbi:MAG: glycosyltransferase family 2 protein [Sedimentisphaerales bacterium]|nr:glycosyltransferase family 2 protein [Sedimentisphaerales bacterium]